MNSLTYASYSCFMKNKKDTKNSKKDVGNLGEDIAAQFLMKQGYLIKDRNYLRSYGEIDIVAYKNGIYHFIEVKTVSCKSLDEVIHETGERHRPEDKVHPWKLMRLARVIQAYVAEHNAHDLNGSFMLLQFTLIKATEKPV